MKLLILCIMLLPFTMALTHRECSTACRTDYDTGGRVANTNDKGPYGLNNNNIDCTCVFTWVRSSGDNECQIYCSRQRYTDKYCHYGSGFCILHVGLYY